MSCRTSSFAIALLLVAVVCIAVVVVVVVVAAFVLFWINNGSGGGCFFVAILTLLFHTCSISQSINLYNLRQEQGMTMATRMIVDVVASLLCGLRNKVGGGKNKCDR